MHWLALMHSLRLALMHWLRLMHWLACMLMLRLMRSRVPRSAVAGRAARHFSTA